MPSLSAPDGTQLVYDAFEPAQPRAAVLVLHGWSDHAGRWREAGERLCDAGLAAYLLDLRGHGRSGGRRGHLSRFSQLLGDLQAFRRVVRLRTAGPQIVFGLSFGGLVALRYLETQPSDPIAAGVISCPWLGLAVRPPLWKVVGARLLADLWPTVALPARIDPEHLSRDPAVNRSYGEDASVPECVARDPMGAARRSGRRLPHRVPAAVPAGRRRPHRRFPPRPRLRRRTEGNGAGAVVSRHVS